VDQKWIDLAPGLFPGIHVLRDPTCNIAYWNLHERGARLARVDGRWQLDGDPVRFFHYSGFDPDDLERISRHQDRFRLADLPQLRPLFQGYRDRLLAEGHAAARRLPYGFACFDNGIPIPADARAIYRALDPAAAARLGDPFATSHPRSFLAYLQEG